VARRGSGSDSSSMAYHKRSNVEATFSAIRRVFGDSVPSKTRVAQINEVLLKETRMCLSSSSPAAADAGGSSWSDGRATWISPSSGVPVAWA
jgi:hypothetical protein